MTYQTPSPAIASLVNLKPDPLLFFGPDRNLMLIAERPSYPSIEELREPKLKLAGRQINPATYTPYGHRGYHAPRLRDLRTGEETPLKNLPENGTFRSFTWSPSGTRIAFCLNTPTGLQLWSCPTETLECTPHGPADLNNSLGGYTFEFVSDDVVMTKRRIPNSGESPDEAVVTGPNVQDTSGKEGRNRTYTNLLQSQHDVEVFRYYATAQIWLVNLATGEEKKWGEPGIISGVKSSPDKKYFVAVRITEPFSFSVPFEKFADRIEILDAEGNLIRLLCERPAREHIPAPFDAVASTPRRFSWRSDHPAQLYWSVAQDGGDTRNEAEFRDQLFYLEPPFTGEPQPSIKMPLRYGAIRWGRGDLAIFIDWSYKDRRQVTRRWWPDSPDRPAEVIFDQNWEDDYNDPGNFMTITQRNDHSVLLTRDEGTKLVLAGIGHGPEGSQPFIDTYEIATGNINRLWQSTPPLFEYPGYFLDEHPDWFFMGREQTTERPNFFLRNLITGEEIQLTDYEHPYPQLRDANLEKLEYLREDGVQLRGDLHTPQGFVAGESDPLPVFMWAYPQEYKDAEKAGQVTTSPHQFTRISPLSPLPFLAAGFAVFDDFAMPIVGEGDQEPNETFIEQVQLNAKAAVEKLIELGVADPERIYVGGHSYGAFMTAHLLAHTDLFAGGIARSGAYNRTLTPFGFQAEERSFWEVPDTYIKLSPFVHADKIDAPLLLIHGEEDANSGTYPVQSKRLFAALNSLGKTARLCLLPHEDHSYAAEESILHMLWEMERWMTKEEA
ncbi:S9 family peptidase [Neolewinella aurantiaca]|uniref:S9 family peptidase n=1 Tax=Neolewinella aurantiaca TaxID=2602767 RepID=A0A5C7FRZ7_9BACT|nr:prolyl oligopeptidase family serine peptidase [Neolewinella aurantiaca]TXF88916.1 S9 family peptidase [Neolewinella aurantiaca]